MRLFIALNLPAGVRAALHAAAAPLRDAAPGARWVRPEKLHLTLEFLGERPDDIVAPLRSGLDAVAARHRAVTLELRRVGAFPNLRRPRVVWVGIEPSPEVMRLQRDVSDLCAALGVPREGRPFRPHVTLARIALRTARSEIEALARAGRAIEIDVHATTRTLDLMESVGGRYVLVHAAPLS